MQKMSSNFPLGAINLTKSVNKCFYIVSAKILLCSFDYMDRPFLLRIGNN